MNCDCGRVIIRIVKGKCHLCYNAEYSKTYKRKSNPDFSKYHKSNSYKKYMKRYNKAYRIKNKDIRNAHLKVERAIKSGFLIKHPCEECNSTKRVHAHHDNYKKPLEVKWLCPTHHVARHKILGWWPGKQQV